MTDSTPGIVISKDGPYLLTGLPLGEQAIAADDDGNSWSWQQLREFEVKPTYALCRCGQSAHKPFCDGTHAKVDFDGTETASGEPYDQVAQVINGPTMQLQDDSALCAFARFCDGHGGVWNLVEETDHENARELVAHEAAQCPSGRLVVRDGAPSTPVEPDYEASAVLIEDPAQSVSGPIWVRGGVNITSASGETYEVRNRVTLCRCGASQNKPFCDGTHASIGFRAGGAGAGG